MLLLNRILEIGRSLRVPQGYKETGIRNVLTLTADGKFVSFEEVEGRREYVPAVERTNKIVSSFVHETFIYTLGVGVSSPEKDADRHASFRDALAKNDHPATQAILKFLDDPKRPLLLPLGQSVTAEQLAEMRRETPLDGPASPGKLLKGDKLTDNMKVRRRCLHIIEAAERTHTSSNVPLTMMTLEAGLSDRLLIEVEGHPRWWMGVGDALEKAGGAIGQCGITGETGALSRLVRPGGGKNLISFNFTAVERYGKKQAFNAPTSSQASHDLSVGLSHLARSKGGYCSSVFLMDDMKRRDFIFWGPDRDSEIPRLTRRLLYGSKGDDLLTEKELHRISGPGYTLLVLGSNMKRWVPRRWFDLDGNAVRERLIRWVKRATFTHKDDEGQVVVKTLGGLSLADACTRSDAVKANLVQGFMMYLIAGDPLPKESLSVSFDHVWKYGIRRGPYSGRVLFSLAVEELRMPKDTSKNNINPKELGEWFEHVCAWYRRQSQAHRSLEEKLYTRMLRDPRRSRGALPRTGGVSRQHDPWKVIAVFTSYFLYRLICK